MKCRKSSTWSKQTQGGKWEKAKTKKAGAIWRVSVWSLWIGGDEEKTKITRLRIKSAEYGLYRQLLIENFLKHIGEKLDKIWDLKLRKEKSQKMRKSFRIDC